MGGLLFSYFRVTNGKLMNEKNSLITAVSKWPGLRLSITFFVFSLLCCNTYVIFIWGYWILMAYASSTRYLLTRLRKKLSSCEAKEEWPYVGLYDYNGKQIELFSYEMV